jgi:predicted small secreted protein
MFSKEIRNRIKLSVAAYAYEYLGETIMSDHEFDELSLQINPNEETGNKKMDEFFKNQFAPHTGMWIRTHPEVEKLHEIYQKYYKKTIDI